jgi:hypothetical protein
MAAVAFALDEASFFAQPIPLGGQGAADGSGVEAISIQLFGPQMGGL